jgi:hypothetical protein
MEILFDIQPEPLAERVAHVERSSADPRRGGRRRAWDDASIRKPVLIDQMVPSSPS